MDIVRASERHACDLVARVRVCGRDATQVVPSRARVTPGGTLNARVINFGAGGIGLRTGLFLPRGAGIEVEIGGESLFRVEGRVQRVTQVGRGPEFEVGVAFAPHVTDDERRRVCAVMASAALSSGAPAAGVGP